MYKVECLIFRRNEIYVIYLKALFQLLMLYITEHDVRWRIEMVGHLRTCHEPGVAYLS